MKKIAICISGQMRDLSRENQILDLISHFNADVFISTWDNLGSTTAYDRFFPTSELASCFIEKDDNNHYMLDIRKFQVNYPEIYKLFYPHIKIDDVIIKNVIPNVKKINIEIFPPNYDSKCILNGITYPKELLSCMPSRYKYSLPMFYKIYDADKLRQEYEIEKSIKYDVVVRTRFDIEFTNLKEIIGTINSEIEENTVITPHRASGNPKNELFINDTFAFGTSKTMSKYSNLYLHLNDYWNLEKHTSLPWNRRAAESLLGYHILKSSKLNHKSLISFSFVKTKISKKTYTKILQSLNQDIKGLNYLKISLRQALCILRANMMTEQGLYDFTENELKELDNYLNLFTEEKDAATEYYWLKAIINKRLANISQSYYYYRKTTEFISHIDAKPAIEFSVLLRGNKLFTEALKILTPLTIIHTKNYFLFREIGQVYFSIANNLKDDFSKEFHMLLSKSFLQQSCSMAEYKNELCNQALEKCLKALSNKDNNIKRQSIIK